MNKSFSPLARVHVRMMGDGIVLSEVNEKITVRLDNGEIGVYDLYDVMYASYWHMYIENS